MSKVPEVTLVFWIIKIAATTLGETGGDTVTMTLNWGYLAGTALFVGLLVVLVVAQIRAKKFHPFLYWATIVASTTFGTTMADFADRSLGIGYTGGSTLLFACLLACSASGTGRRAPSSVNTVTTPKVEAFYWAAITFSQTLGTALGDWMADTAASATAAARWCSARRLPWSLGALFLDQRLARAAVLGGLHPDAAARRHGRRLPRQAGEQWRPRAQPPARVAVIAVFILACLLVLPQRAGRPPDAAEGAAAGDSRRSARGASAPPARLRLPGEAEVAMRGAFHHGLRARQPEIGIESLDHRVVAVAMDEMAQFGETELLVEFGVATARHVEIEPIVARRDDLDIEAAASRPDLLGHRLECGQAVPMRPRPSARRPRWRDGGWWRRPARAFAASPNFSRAASMNGISTRPSILRRCRWLISTSSVLSGIGLTCFAGGAVSSTVAGDPRPVEAIGGAPRRVPAERTAAHHIDAGGNENDADPIASGRQLAEYRDGEERGGHRAERAERGAARRAEQVDRAPVEDQGDDPVVSTP